jgi:hypothetical protein
MSASAVLLAAATLLVALSSLAACDMPGGSTTGSTTTASSTPSAFGSPTAQTAHSSATPAPATPPHASGASGSIHLQWQPGSLTTQFNLEGLAANTLTQGFVVPGTCANPGGTATFRSRAAITGANGSLTGLSTTLGILPSGVRLPKAIEVVQQGQIVLCGDTSAASSASAVGSSSNPSGSATITLQPASGPAPKQVHS